jgi:hypothetical protein
MKKKLLAMALLLAGLTVSTQAALALVIAPPPGPMRVVQSDAVFVGKVVSFEPVDVEVKNVKYTIAIVQVNQALHGLKDEKTIRVGFIPYKKPQPGEPITSGSLRRNDLQLGQEGLFMVRKHPEGKFYLPPMFGYFTDVKQKNFEDEVKSAKAAAAIVANPIAALKSKDADDRLLAAAIQIDKYRTPRGAAKLEPIDAEESKLILDAIVNAKWAPVRFGSTNPYQLFQRLGITEKDGWTPPRNAKSQDDIRQAVETWVREKGGSYRIQRYVAAEK